MLRTATIVVAQWGVGFACYANIYKINCHVKIAQVLITHNTDEDGKFTFSTQMEIGDAATDKERESFWFHL